MNSIIEKYNLGKDKYILFVYLFLLLTPWGLFKSQVAIFSSVLFVWGLIKYKEDVLQKLSIVWKFKPLLLWLGFVLFCFISVLWSDSFTEGFKRVFNFHKYEFLFGTALLISLTKEQAITAIKVLLFSFVGYALFSTFIYFDIINIVGSSALNPKGILRFSISTQYMVIASFISIIFAIYSKNKNEQIVLVLVSLLSIFALFINYSRTSQLAFILILMIFVIIFSVKNIKLAIVNILLVVIVLFSFSQNERMVSKFNSALQEVENIYNNNIYSGSFGVRLFFNKTGIEMIKENPFFGVGPVDNRNILVEKEKSDENYKSVIVKHFHSEHMEILTAYGLVGYLLLVSAIVLLIIKLRKQNLYYYISLSVFLSLFFISFANKTLALKPLNYIYVIFFILLSIIAYYNEEEKVLREGRE